MDRDLRRFTPLVVLAKTLVQVEENKVSVGNLSKCIRLLDVVTTELCWRRGPVTDLIVPHYLSAALSDYKLLRETAASVSPVITSSIDYKEKSSNTSIPPKNPYIKDESVSKMIEFLISQAKICLDEGNFQADKPPSQAVLATRTLIRILNYLESSWESWVILLLFQHLDLLTTVLCLVGHADPMISKRARMFFYHLPVPNTEVSPLVILTSLKSAFFGSFGERSVTLRKEVLTIARIFAYNFSFNLEALGKYSDFIVSCLFDSNAEVRNYCSEILSSLHRFADNDVTTSHLKQFQEWAATPLDKSTKSSIVVRHAGCLGLASMILAFPYEIPSFLPNVIVSFAKHSPDPDPIGSLVRSTIRSFWKTHFEQWGEHEQRFSEEELVILKGCIVSQSHYV
ncbi:hypothetical protein RCL1_007055 [Eukaryota sp. TZLM3-RCL]